MIYTYMVDTKQQYLSYLLSFVGFENLLDSHNSTMTDKSDNAINSLICFPLSRTYLSVPISVLRPVIDFLSVCCWVRFVFVILGDGVRVIETGQTKTLKLVSAFQKKKAVSDNFARI